MRRTALVAVASLGLCACEVADEAAGKPSAPAPVIDAAPAIANPAEDAGAVSPLDAAYDGPYPDVTETGVAYVLTDDTVLDSTNHLMWQRNETGKYFEEPPTAYCATLGLGGFTDWRPPTLAELKTLLVVQPNCPLLDHEAFPSALCDWYISSNIVNGDIYAPDMLDFATGITKNLTDVGVNQAYSARCVRTSP